MKSNCGKNAPWPSAVRALKEDQEMCDSVIERIHKAREDAAGKS